MPEAVHQRTKSRVSFPIAHKKTYIVVSTATKSKTRAVVSPWPTEECIDQDTPPRFGSAMSED